jgi:hypothetical protein
LKLQGHEQSRVVWLPTYPGQRGSHRSLLLGCTFSEAGEHHSRRKLLLVVASSKREAMQPDSPEHERQGRLFPFSCYVVTRHPYPTSRHLVSQSSRIYPLTIYSDCKKMPVFTELHGFSGLTIAKSNRRTSYPAVCQHITQQSIAGKVLTSTKTLFNSKNAIFLPRH